MISLYLWATLIITLAYIIQTIIVYGWIKSISHSYMIRSDRWLFRIWCWLTAVLLFFALIEIASLVIFVSLGLIIVGMTPNLDNPIENKVHYIGAVMSIIAGCGVVVQVHLITGLILTGIIGVFGILAYRYNLRNKVFWIEILSLFSILGIFLIKGNNYGRRNLQKKQKRA